MYKVWEVVFVLKTDADPWCDGPYLALADTKEQAIAKVAAGNVEIVAEVLAAKAREFCGS